jgi:phage I-like protein
MKHALLTALLIALQPSLKTRLANEAPPDVLLTGIANEISAPPDASGEQWVKVPYGNFDHSKGLQVFDKAAAEAMANEFNKPIARMLRWASRTRGGAPVFIGHPDVFPNENRDKSAYGWVREMRVDADGLAMLVRWTPEGRELIANERYRFFSPVWDATAVAGKSRQFRPAGLVSLGLTNTPNIPVEPLANEAAPMPLPDWLAEVLGVPVDADKDSVLAALAAKVEGAKTMSEAKAADEAAKLAAETAEKEKAMGEKAAAETALANTRTELCELLVAAAVKEGRLPAVQAGEWKQRLATNFANERTALAALRAVLPTGGGKTAELGARKSEGDAGLATLANEYVAKNGGSFAAAWAAVSKNRK